MIVRFDELAAQITRAPRSGPVRFVAIDGPGGSGKSTFAARLARSLREAPVIATDDFASHSEPIEWWWRLEEVLAPLQAGRPARFQPYDWGTRRRAGWRTVPPAPVVIIEGVGSARRAVRDRLSFAVWIATGRRGRLARGLARDGEPMREYWLGWMAAEDAHYAADPTIDAVDLVVDGEPTLAHDPEREFVVIRSAAAPP